MLGSTVEVIPALRGLILVGRTHEMIMPFISDWARCLQGHIRTKVRERERRLFEEVIPEL